MKKTAYILASTLLIVSLAFVACKKKKDSGATGPCYKSDCGTGSNPDPNNVTTTGNQTFAPVPTENSALVVGGGGWSNPSCATTNSVYLKANNGSTEVTLVFWQPPPIGTSNWLVASYPGSGTVVFTVLNAPSQPENIVWYGRSGTIQVTNTGTVVNASIQTPVRCEQSNFKFPSVTATGVLGCN
jgi:hypothetical protein